MWLTFSASWEQPSRGVFFVGVFLAGVALSGFSVLVRPLQRIQCALGLKPEGRLFGYLSNAGGSWEEEKMAHLRWAFSVALDFSVIVYL